MGARSASRARADPAPLPLPTLQPRGGVLDTPHDVVTQVRRMHLAMVAAVVNGEGICRVAELAASAAEGCVAIVVPRLGAACLAAHDDAGHAQERMPAELERHVADRVGGRLSAKPNDVVAEVPVIFGDEMVGAVLLLGDADAPEDMVLHFLHEAAMASLMHVAVRDAHSGAVQQLRGSAVEELRARAERASEELVRRAGRRGCDISHGGVALCIHPTVPRPGHVTATVLDENPTALTLQLSGGDGDRSSRIVALLPARCDRDDAEVTRAAANRLAERLEPYGRVGISSVYPDASHFARAIHEAELMVEVLCRSNGLRPGCNSVGSATYRVLFRMLASHPEELRVVYEDTVAPLVRYDAKHHTELLPTLEAYLDRNCNMNATAAAMFAHRHTIAYRLERLYQLTELDPARFDDREQLALGLKAYQMMRTVANVG
jgi:sugar diacid utilization regulator